MYKREVLSVYRRILRVSKTWKASSGRVQDTIEERNYIKKECKELFRKNIGVKFGIFHCGYFCLDRNANEKELIKMVSYNLAIFLVRKIYSVYMFDIFQLNHCSLLFSD